MIQFLKDTDISTLALKLAPHQLIDVADASCSLEVDMSNNAIDIFKLGVEIGKDVIANCPVYQVDDPKTHTAYFFLSTKTEVLRRLTTWPKQ